MLMNTYHEFFEAVYTGPADEEPEEHPRIPLDSPVVDDEVLVGHAKPQAPVDIIDEASMESFPCSDPPAYTCSHA